MFEALHLDHCINPICYLMLLFKITLHLTIEANGSSTHLECCAENE